METRVLGKKTALQYCLDWICSESNNEFIEEGSLMDNMDLFGKKAAMPSIESKGYGDLVKLEVSSEQFTILVKEYIYSSPFVWVCGPGTTKKHTLENILEFPSPFPTVHVLLEGMFKDAVVAEVEHGLEFTPYSGQLTIRDKGVVRTYILSVGEYSIEVCYVGPYRTHLKVMSSGGTDILSVPGEPVPTQGIIEEGSEEVLLEEIISESHYSINTRMLEENFRAVDHCDALVTGMLAGILIARKESLGLSLERISEATGLSMEYVAISARAIDNEVMRLSEKLSQTER
jgi:hypothetical protein